MSQLKLTVCFSSIRAPFQAVELFPLPSATVPPWKFLHRWENSLPGLPTCLWFFCEANLCNTAAQTLNGPLFFFFFLTICSFQKWVLSFDIYKHTIQSNTPPPICIQLQNWFTDVNQCSLFTSQEEIKHFQMILAVPSAKIFFFQQCI